LWWTLPATGRLKVGSFSEQAWGVSDEHRPVMAGQQLVQHLAVRLWDLLGQQVAGATTSTRPGSGAISASG
jgi:hypothetical protein